MDLERIITNPTGLKEILDVVSKPEDLAASPYQIHNFILGRREFCTDWAQMRQAKVEIFGRICELNDMMYDYELKEIEIERYKRKLNDTNDDLDKREFNLEIKKREFALSMIRLQAQARLNEAREFFSVYKRYEDLDTNEPQLEEEQWRIKSRYYPELRERYNQSDRGILPYPHQKELP